MPCAPRGANSKGIAVVCLALAHAYPILAPMAKMSLVPHIITAWRTQGHGAASTEGPQPVPSAPAGRCSTGSPGMSSAQPGQAKRPVLALISAHPAAPDGQGLPCPAPHTAGLASEPGCWAAWWQ